MERGEVVDVGDPERVVTAYEEAKLREAGIDEFIHVGVDVVACLEIALSELGLSV